jgi:hypothetical protein
MVTAIIGSSLTLRRKRMLANEKSPRENQSANRSIPRMPAAPWLG